VNVYTIEDFYTLTYSQSRELGHSQW